MTIINEQLINSVIGDYSTTEIKCPKNYGSYDRWYDRPKGPLYSNNNNIRRDDLLLASFCVVVFSIRYFDGSKLWWVKKRMCAKIYARDFENFTPRRFWMPLIDRMIHKIYHLCPLELLFDVFYCQVVSLTCLENLCIKNVHVPPLLGLKF